MPSAPSSDRHTPGRPGNRDAWPTAGTRVFSGADLDAAMNAAVAELGSDIDVRAARSVKQGLRGRTHVEVLVAVPDVPRPPLPPSEQPASRRRRAQPDDGSDPVESTLAALLASAEEEELALLHAGRGASAPAAGAGSAGTVVPFDPPQLAGGTTFAAEFAAAFPAALAAAKNERDRADADPAEPVAPASTRVKAPLEDFTSRVRDALRRVPEEIEPEAAVPAGTSVEVAVASGAETLVPEVLDPRPPRAPHPALDLLDEPTVQLPAVQAPAAPPVVQLPTETASVRPAPAPAATPSPAPSGRAESTGHGRPEPGCPEPGRPAPEARRPRPRPTPGASAATRPSPGTAFADRPTALRGGRPATAAWSRTRLRNLGVPDEVLAALPAEEPADDLRWLVALTDAIAAVVPAPVEDGDADVTASGRGLRGALALMRLGVAGVAPQTLVVDGRSLPATATELALAVRAGILR